jgi:hypothetical protein
MSESTKTSDDRVFAIAGARDRGRLVDLATGAVEFLDASKVQWTDLEAL